MAGFITSNARSMRRSFISLSLAFLAVFAGGAAANEVVLRPFHASYDVYMGGMRLAVSELSLENNDAGWYWTFVTRARGIYKLFTDKQPFSETHFRRFGDGFLVTEMRLGDHGGEQPYEIAHFDWIKSLLEVTRKKKRSEVRLGNEVYDYLSIHLLAASMGETQLPRPVIDFYRKGKLIKVRFVYSGRQTVNIGEESIEANVYEQVAAHSKSKIKYYYDVKNPLLPLRIEKLEAGESPSIMTLNKVEWGS